MNHEEHIMTIRLLRMKVNQIRLKTSMQNYSNYSNAYILVKETITVVNTLAQSEPKSQ